MGAVVGGNTTNTAADVATAPTHTAMYFTSMLQYCAVAHKNIGKGESQSDQHARPLCRAAHNRQSYAAAP